MLRGVGRGAGLQQPIFIVWNLEDMDEGDIERLKMQKRNRFHVVLEWERKQSEDSGKYKRILDCLIGRLLKRVLNSREANRAVVKFLSEKAKGYRVYSEVMLRELTYLPDPPSDLQSLNSEPIIQYDPANTLKLPSLRQGLGSVSEHQTSLSKTLTTASTKIQ